MTDIITVTANPTIDVSTTVGRIEPFTKLRCAFARKDPGGGGINVARVVKRLGGDVAAIHPAGGVTGRLLVRLLDREGVASRSISTIEETREDFTVLEERTRNQYRYVLPGPRLSEDEWRACRELVIAAAAHARWVVISGSLPPSVANDAFADLTRVIKQAGARIAIDSAGLPMRLAVAEGPHLIKPNLHEFEELTGMQGAGMQGAGMQGAGRQALIEASRRLVANFGIEMVALSLGSDGAVLVTADDVLSAHGLDIAAESVVGAGDSFMGALIWSLTAGHQHAEALRYAVAAGSAALMRPGTGLCRVEDVLRLVGEVSVESLNTEARGAV